MSKSFSSASYPGGPASWIEGIESKYGKSYSPCYHSHPALAVGKFQVFGGSCSSPQVNDADIFIGFDSNMTFKQSFPWDENRIEQVFFKITDGSAPKSPEEFKKLVKWSAEQVAAGKKLHAGCIGGHGRTGLFLAALVTVMTGEKDSIVYVRDNYCHKAVESATQVGFLVKHFGIKKAGGSKAEVMLGSGTSSWVDGTSVSLPPMATLSRAESFNAKYVRDKYKPKPESVSFSKAEKSFEPMEGSEKFVW